MSRRPKVSSAWVTMSLAPPQVADDLRPVRGEQARVFAPDAAAGTGDDRNPALEAARLCGRHARGGRSVAGRVAGEELLEGVGGVEVFPHLGDPAVLDTEDVRVRV